MAVKQNPKNPTNLANAYSFRDPSDVGLRAAAIFVVNDDGTIETDNEVGVFLLNPSTWTDSKSTNWSEQAIPGQSDPVLQWVSGGARKVSFQALVSADTSYFVSGQKIQPGKSSNSTLDQASSIFGGIASAFFKVSAPPPRISTGEKASDLDITLFLDYYRSLLYPTYDDVEDPKKLEQSPPLVVLYAGTAFTKLPYGNRVTAQHDLWVVTNVEIQITKQLPNLAPMEAMVSFQLTQYNIRSFSRDRFLRQDQ